MVGAGAVGAYYGARLQRVGNRVAFLLRSDLESVRQHGFRIRAADGAFDLPEVEAYASTREMGTCNLVIIALKATSNSLLPTLLPPLIGPDTVLLTLQNGLGGDAFLAEHFGRERVLAGLCFVCLNRTAPGLIENAIEGYITLGAFDGHVDGRVEEVARIFREAGVRIHLSDDIPAVRWRKLVWNIPFNGLTITAGGVPTDRILSDPSLVAEVRLLMAEVARASTAFGHEIPASFLDRQIELTGPMGAYQPSSLVDFLAGREVELEAIWGEPLRQAEAAGVSMPRLRRLYQAIRQAIADRGG
ncbi:MAG: 2-dehydropantoate 2-reductase [Opitutaceae bacterium]